MATEEARSAIDAGAGAAAGAAAPPPQPRRITLFGLIGLVLALALAAVALVQARQFALLKQTIVYQDDYVVLSIYQVEAEYLRLREHWLRSQFQDDAGSRQALQLRYEIWVSRVGLLRNERTARLMVGNADYAAPLHLIDGFIARKVELEPRAAKLYQSLVQESYAELSEGEVTITNVLTKLLRLSQLDNPLR